MRRTNVMAHLCAGVSDVQASGAPLCDRETCTVVQTVATIAMSRKNLVFAMRSVGDPVPLNVGDFLVNRQ